MGYAKAFLSSPNVLTCPSKLAKPEGLDKRRLEGDVQDTLQEKGSIKATHL
jgi:hypothetical protein